MMSTSRWTRAGAGALLVAALGLLGSCKPSTDTAQNAPSPAPSAPASRSVPAGTPIEVTLGSTLSSETAQLGEQWHGTVTRTVATPSGASIAAGSRVTGEVVGVTAAKRGSRAMLQLGLTQVQVDGSDRAIRADAAAVTAGSTRKRNLGAIAGGAVAGALIGKAVGDGHNAAAGGLIGGAAATGVVAGSKGFQVVLASGAVMHFTVSQTVAMR